MAGEPVESSPVGRYSKEQKIGIGLLLIFAITSVSLGFLQIRNRLYKPFSLNNTMPGVLKEEVDTVEALRYRDTDFDGLTDFDEQYVYGTSVYLADTDSDGIKDKQEVDKGTNPLCAAGKQCEAEDPSVDTTLGVATTSTVDLEDAFTDATKLLSDPAYVRKLLVQNGLKQQEVDKFTDEQVLQMIQSALKETNSTDSQTP